jgi:hypothetical protein
LVNDDDFGLNIELGTFAKSLQKKSSGHWLFPFFLDKIQWK